MVRPDLYRVAGALQEVSPLLQGPDNREHLLVVDLIVPFDRGEGLAIERDRMPFVGFRRWLREDSTSRKVGAVRFNPKRGGVVGRGKDGGRGDGLLESIEGLLLVGRPLPF